MGSEDERMGLLPLASKPGGSSYSIQLNVINIVPNHNNCCQKALLIMLSKYHLPGPPACTLLAVGEGQASSSLEEEAHRILSSATNHC